MNAKEILQQAKQFIAEKYGYKSWNDMFYKWKVSDSISLTEWTDRCFEASLLAMERIAEMSWDASEKFTHFEYTFGLGPPNDHPDKSTYMNNLFPIK